MLILLLAAAAAAPHPGPLKLFEDWTVGCDNGRVCEAVALPPEDAEPGQWLAMSVRRTAEPGAAVRISFDTGGEEGAVPPAALVADGKRLPVTIVQGELGPEVSRGTEAVLAALRSATKLSALDAKGRSLGAISVAGASAAFLYMDDRQQRVGTVTALVHPGAKPLAAVPRVPAYPVIRAAALSSKPPRRMPKAEWMKLRNAACGDDQPDQGGAAEFHRLDAGHSLAYIPSICLSGAYNQAALLLVAGETGPWRAAEYDVPTDNGGEGSPSSLAFNAGWNATSGQLDMYMKGRGLGDCGITQAFAWDGTRFRLIQLSRMDECRGTLLQIGTWHAEVARP